MKVALHVHTSRLSGCADAEPEEMIEEYINCGFDALFFTEHDAVWPRADLQGLRAAYPDIQIFPAIELSLFQPRSFVHLLILGAADEEYLYLASADKVIDKAREDNFLTVLAHPYRYDSSDEILRRGIYPDAMELRSNTHLEQHAALARAFASEHAIRLVNSDDAHSIEDIGNFWVETDRPLERPGELREIVLAGEYGCEQLGR